MSSTFWISTASALAAAGIIALVTWLVHRLRQHHKEKKVVCYLRENTEDRPGKQFLPTASVAKAVNLGEEEVARIANRLPSVFRGKIDNTMIGLYETERSVYEERGILTLGEDGGSSLNY